MKSPIIPMDLVLTEAYRIYEISLYILLTIVHALANKAPKPTD